MLNCRLLTSNIMLITVFVLNIRTLTLLTILVIVFERFVMLICLKTARREANFVAFGQTPRSPEGLGLIWYLNI